MLSQKKAAAVFLAFFLFAIAIPRPAAAIEKQERIIAGSPSDSMEVRHLVLTGTNEEIGRALAEIAIERFQARAERSTDVIRTRATRHYIEKNYPILYERMRGVAAAYGQRIDDDSVDHSGLNVTEIHAACSIVHLPPQATADGKSVISRDYDYSTGSLNFGFLPPGMLHPTSRPYLLELHPDHGYASIAMVAYELLSGVLDGMNSEGLTVSLALDDELFTKYQMEPVLGTAPGLGEVQMLRLLLDTCATVEEAKEALLTTKQYYGFVPVHYLIADRFGRSFVWEYSQAHNKEFIIENPGRPLVMTNFSLNKHLDQGGPPTADEARSVCKRYALLTEQLAIAPSSITEEFLRATHRKVDAKAAPAADQSRPPIRTFWHALYYPEERRVKFSFYLHDEPLADHPGNVRVVRSDYLEFRLAATTHGSSPAMVSASVVSASPASSAVASPAVVADKSNPVVDRLKAAGATVALDHGRIVTVVLDKTADPESLLTLVAGLPDVTQLGIQNPKMTDAGMVLVAKMSKLTVLNVASSAVGDRGMEAITALTHLQYLGLKGTKITNAAIPSIARLTALVNLNIADTQITDAGVAPLATLVHLESVSFANDTITDAALPLLARSPSLAGLNLSGTKITDAGLASLKPLGRLTKLNVTKTSVTANGVAEAKKYLPFWATIQQ